MTVLKEPTPRKDRITKAVIAAMSKMQEGSREYSRIEVATVSSENLSFLKFQPFAVKGYFRFKDRPAALWFGVAKEFSSVDKSVLDQLPDRATLYGGMRFDSERSPSSKWRSFKKKRFFLPRFEVIESRLYINIVKGDTHRVVLDELSLIEWDLPCQGQRKPKLIAFQKPKLSRWQEKVKKVQAQGLDKVVLAQQFVAEFDIRICPWGLMNRLQGRFFKRGSDPSNLPFLFSLQIDNQTFIGASPERLYLRHGKMLSSEALAGTAFRQDKFIDLESELLKSQKDVMEHAFVVDSLEKSFSKLCTTFSKSKLQSKKAAHLIHLHKSLSGVLNMDISDEDLLTMLHPTPAVGGVPTQEAIKQIRETETFDRGWYSGPIGMVSKQCSEFVVAIRSGLIEGETLTLYGGCGIVAASNAEKEYEESLQKIQTLLSSI